MTAAAFDRNALIKAFDAIGAAAVAHGARLELAVYGGSALMLASNFRFSTEDVDIAEIGTPWPSWLSDVVADLARQNAWPGDWLNDAVTFHLSPLASRAADHLEFGTFPRDTPTGLSVVVPTTAYMLALKLKAMRILDPIKGEQEARDIVSLMRVLDADDDAAMVILSKYFPKSAQDGMKQRFLLKHLRSTATSGLTDAPRYPR